ncbi:hypothetical protein CTAYLR_006185 [Chrysophaeum taylorii]|uniref:Protein-tyrosine sulfotransferase n=1 Tax=Chrysophaeum taylorii TaxID=2483200 RepID=A0AAD7UN56_9STRA|nr:hypothetical protein CTAYLR_006185 [Chrysophaeum taylorii]
MHLIGWLLLVVSASADFQCRFDDDEGNKKQALRGTMLVLKSPRVGSTYLRSVLEAHPNVVLEWEVGSISNVKKSMACANASIPRACGASINDFVKTRERTCEIFRLVAAMTPRVVLQLRWNVVEKSLSAYRLFNRDFVSRKKRCRDDEACVDALRVDAKAIATGARRGDETIRATVAAATWLASPYIFVFYEDLIRETRTVLVKIYDFLGVPRCDACARPARFSPLEVPNLDELVAAFSSDLDDAEYLRMLDPRFNLEVHTPTRLARLQGEKNAHDRRNFTVGHWRRRT